MMKGLSLIVSFFLFLFFPGMTSHASDGPRYNEISKKIRPFERGDRWEYEVISKVRYSPDGQFFAVCSGKNAEVRIYHAVSHKIWKTLKINRDTIWALAFSPDGNLLVSGTKNGKVIVWDVYAGKRLKTLNGHSSRVNDLVFSPGGEFVASASADRTSRLWNVETWETEVLFDKHEPGFIPGHSEEVLALAFNAEGTKLISGGRDNNIKVWDVATGKMLKTMNGSSQIVSALSISPDGGRLITAECRYRDNSPCVIGFYDTMNWELEKRVEQGGGNRYLNIRSNRIEDISFHPSGSFFLAASTDRSITFWDLDGNPKGKITSVHRHHSAQFNPEGDAIVTGSDNYVIIWDNRTGRLRRFIQMDDPMYLTYSKKRKAIASASRGNKVLAWDSKGEKVAEFKGGRHGINGLEFNASGAILATLECDENTNRPCNIGVRETGEKNIKWKKTNYLKHKLKRGISGISFHPEKNIFATAHHRDHTTRILDLTGGEVEKLTSHSEMVHSMKFSPFGNYLLTGAADRAVKLWDVHKWRLVETFIDHKQISRDRIRALERQSYSREYSNRRNKKGVRQVSFSPDGRYTATASDDAIVSLRDFLSGKIRHKFGLMNPLVRALLFSSDSRYLLIGGGDTIRIHDVDTNQLKGEIMLSGFMKDMVFVENDLYVPSSGGISVWSFPLILKLHGAPWELSAPRHVPIPRAEVTLLGNHVTAGDHLRMKATVHNMGEGTVYRLMATIESAAFPTLDGQVIAFGKIEPGKAVTKEASFPISATEKKAKDQISIRFLEGNGYVPDPISFSIEVEELEKPDIARRLLENRLRQDQIFHFLVEKKISRDTLETYLENYSITYDFLIAVIGKNMISSDFLDTYILGMKLSADEVMGLIPHGWLKSEVATQIYIGHPDFFNKRQVQTLKKDGLLLSLNLKCLYKIDDKGPGTVGNGDGALQPGETVYLDIAVHNLNNFDVKNVELSIKSTLPGGIRMFNKKENLGDFKHGKIKDARFLFSILKNIDKDHIPLKIKMTEKYFMTFADVELNLPLNKVISPTVIAY